MFWLNRKRYWKVTIFENSKLFYRLEHEVKLEIISVLQTKFNINGLRSKVTNTFLLSDKRKIKGFHLKQIKQSGKIIAKWKNNKIKDL